MSSVKQVILYGLLAKTPETGSVYGAGVTLVAATDGVLLGREALMDIGYAELGERIAAPGSAAAMMRRAPPSGRIATFPVRMEMRGLASAYSAPVTPPDGVHTMMLISGHQGIFTTDHWDYTPISSAWNSAGGEGYSRGQKYVLAGLYSDFNFLLENPGIMFLEFPTSALLTADPTDVSLPAITYLPSAVIPPKANNIVLNIHGVTTTKVRRISGKKNQVIAPRLDINSGGHAGFAMGQRMMTVEIEIEATALATLNPYALWSAGTQLSAFTFTVGAAANNKWKFLAPAAYIVDVKEGTDGPSATWILTIVCPPTTATANDDYTITYLA